jgi:hypothetical protein
MTIECTPETCADTLLIGTCADMFLIGMTSLHETRYDANERQFDLLDHHHLPYLREGLCYIGHARGLKPEEIHSAGNFACIECCRLITRFLDPVHQRAHQFTDRVVDSQRDR